MSRIAVVIDDLFEDVEYSRPAAAFKQAGHELVHVGLEQGKTVTGKKQGTRVTVDVTAADASPDDYDALLIPGGYSPDRLRAHEEPVTFVRDFVQSGKPVFFICHGAQLLITARVAQGRKMTGWTSIVQDIKNAGADYRDRSVVIDDNLVSSRHPGDLDDFIQASLDKLG
ncbi:MAG: type 1 glutamine amidotransferase [Candidatus Thermoplasmatota archaeon]|nr:type 1 glutamine amidotransferase [Candidatus Thermoplasmatota archaeon]